MVILNKVVFKRKLFNKCEGNPPEVNLANEKNNGETVFNLINNNLVLSAHDVSSGGLIVALSEMSLGGNIGAIIEKPKKLRNLIAYFFGEDQGRYLLEIDKKNLKQIEKILINNNVYFENIGSTQKSHLEIKNEMKIDLNTLFKANNEWYNNY